VPVIKADEVELATVAVLSETTDNGQAADTVSRLNFADPSVAC
jgi:hypothetical protein